MKTEQWKDIEGYEGYYQVSTLGKVKSLPRFVGSKNEKGNKILKQSLINSGYFTIRLNKNNKGKNFLVHRLMAKVFCPNPQKKPFVNHKNGIKKDNRVENLEWCTRSENCQHAFDIGLNKISEKSKQRLINWNKTDHCSKVAQYTISGEFVAEYKSIKEAAEKTGCNYSNIGNCSSGHRRHKTCGGFIWKKIKNVTSPTLY